MTRPKAIIAFILAIAMIGFAAYVLVFGVGKYQTGAAKNIKLGLDLKGGVSITYQVSKDNGKYSDEDFKDTINKLEKRVQVFSTEAQVQKEGDDKIAVSIPGAYDADAVLAELGKPGSLYFCTKEESTPSKKDIKAKKFVEIKEDKKDPESSQYKGYYKVWVTGDQVKSAKGQASQDDNTKATEYVVSLKFNDEGAKQFGQMTSENVGNQTYIIYDNKVLSAPKVNEAIMGGEAQIDGQKDLEEAENLASNIRIGSLTLSLDEISHKVESAQLGNDALSKSLMAGLIGMIIILVFMLIVYRIPGVAACLALVAYVELILLALNGFDLTLTLPGIAGIILNIGMAVDANVIIYARIREEIANGKTVRTAIKTGFKAATSAIVDGNITTLIAAIVLLWRGSGTVQGFAQTLAIGIIIQLFEALVISRAFVWMLFHMGFQKVVFYGKEKTRKVFKFVQRKAIFFAIAIVCILVGVGAMVVNGTKGAPFNLGIEFAGGSTVKVQFAKEYSIDYFNDHIKKDLEKEVGLKEVQGQQDKAHKDIYQIKTQKLEGKKFDEFQKLLIDKYKAYDPKDSKHKDNFSNEMISGVVSQQMRQDAIIATAIALVCMLIYIWIRFRNVQFALAAVTALFHDVAIVVGFYALARVTLGTTFIACLLTIVGYSINATIVIFDRIRENMKNRRRGDKVIDIVNTSITQTLTRSIYTTFTTFIMVFMIYIMGVTSIQEFTLPLMVGLIAGAFSSVFITGSLWYIFKGRSYDKALN